MSKTIENTVIGTLTKYGTTMCWQGEANLPCFDEPVTLYLHLVPDERQRFNAETIFTQQQLDLLLALQNSCDDIHKRWLSAILSELQADPTIWGWFNEKDELYEIVTSIDDVDTLATMIRKPHLHLLPAKNKQLAYGFGFMDTDWDDEHGYGVVFVGDEYIRGGPLEDAVDEVFQSIDGYRELTKFYEDNPDELYG